MWRQLAGQRIKIPALAGESVHTHNHMRVLRIAGMVPFPVSHAVGAVAAAFVGIARYRAVNMVQTRLVKHGQVCGTGAPLDWFSMAGVNKPIVTGDIEC